MINLLWMLPVAGVILDVTLNRLSCQHYAFRFYGHNSIGIECDDHTLMIASQIFDPNVTFEKSHLCDFEKTRCAHAATDTHRADDIFCTATLAFD